MTRLIDVSPAYELRVSLRGPDGRVCARTRLCWAETPSAAAVLGVLAARAAQARRRGLALVLDSPPDGAAPLLALAGLGEPEGPVGLDGSAGDRLGQPEAGEQ